MTAAGRTAHGRRGGLRLFGQAEGALCLGEERRQDRSTWQQETLDPWLKRAPQRQESFTTLSGLSLPVVADGDDLDSGSIGYPGTYPYTRGIFPTMYRGRLWTMRQYAGFGSADETNRRFRFLLGQGQTGLSVAFDLPTQMGYDSDHAMARGEVGKVGVAIDSVEDMQRLFQDIPLDQVTTSMTINAPAAILLLMYEAVGRRQGVSPDRLGGTIQNDVLKEYTARGTYILPPAASLRLVTDTFRYCRDHLPRFHTISISGYHIREAGSTAPQEVAFTLANALAYVEAAQAAGLEIDSFAPRLSFFFNAQSDLFEEAAKFRAARRLWARLMAERGAKDPRSLQLRFHAQTAGSALTAQQPEVNLARVTLQALAAVLGGAQSLHTNAYDEALALPTEHSALLALRSQQVIAHETGVADVVDPLGGSYLVEQVTNRIEEEARALIDEIQDLGGAVAAIEAGFVQRKIQDAAYRYQQEVEQGRRKVVGVNAFQAPEQERPPLLRVDADVEARQLERLADLRGRRDPEPVAVALDSLERTARGQGNLVEALAVAVAAKATLGEMVGTLVGVYGRYRPKETV